MSEQGKQDEQTSEKIGCYKFSRRTGQLFYGKFELTDAVTPPGKMLTPEFVAAMPPQARLQFNHQAKAFSLIAADAAKIQALAAMYVLPDRVAQEM